MIKKISLMALSGILLATGCTKVQERAVATIGEQADIVNKRMSNMQESRKDEKNVSSVRYSDRVWLGSRGYRQQNGDPLPNKYDNITYITTEPQTLSAIASDISSMTGMRMVVRDADIDSDSSNDSSMDLSGDSAGGIALSYTGDLVGLLNQLSTKFDVFWEHKENVIYLSKYVTRTLALYSLPSTTEVSVEITSESDSSEADVSDESGGDTTQSGTDNSVELTTSLNVWEEIEEVIKSMIPEGSTYAMSPSTGTLTITSSPLAIRKVENLIKKQNEILSRQVVIDVNVMSIVTSETDGFKNDLTATLESLSDNMGLKWAGPNSGIKNFSGNAANTFSSTFTSDSGGNTAGLVINALSEKFENSTVTSSAVTTLNNHTVPLQIITRSAYIKDMEQTVEDDQVTITATPGDVTTGFVMNVLPRILANGNVMLQYSMSISELASLEQKDIGNQGSFLQLPTIVSRDFLQNIKLKSGNTLLLAGYDRTFNNSEQSGVGSYNNYLMGGGKYGEVSKETIVIMITPRIIE